MIEIAKTYFTSLLAALIVRLQGSNVIEHKQGVV